jgi:hypothetical protein
MEAKSQQPHGYDQQQPPHTRDVAPPRRVYGLLVGNFFSRAFALTMSVVAIALASVLIQREGSRYRLAQLLVWQPHTPR